jgi:hypothetical protein
LPGATGQTGAAARRCRPVKPGGDGLWFPALTPFAPPRYRWPVKRRRRD